MPAHTEGTFDFLFFHFSAAGLLGGGLGVSASSYCECTYADRPANRSVLSVHLTSSRPTNFRQAQVGLPITPSSGSFFSSVWSLFCSHGKRRRVFVLGPSHHVYSTACSLPSSSVESYQTPFGDIPLDKDGECRQKLSPTDT